MATPAQITSNRANAQHSTGPRTSEGKETSARNALKHGFNAKRLIVREDEQAEFLELRDRLAAEFRLRTPHMWFLFEQLIHAAWNMKRVQRVEAELFEADGLDPLSNPDRVEQMKLLNRYHARHERSYQRFLKQLRDYQTDVVVAANAVPQSLHPHTPPLTDVPKLHRSRLNALKVYPTHSWTKKPKPEDYDPNAKLPNPFPEIIPDAA